MFLPDRYRLQRTWMHSMNTTTYAPAPPPTGFQPSGTAHQGSRDAPKPRVSSRVPISSALGSGSGIAGSLCRASVYDGSGGGLGRCRRGSHAYVATPPSDRACARAEKNCATAALSSRLRRASIDQGGPLLVCFAARRTTARWLLVRASDVQTLVCRRTRVTGDILPAICRYDCGAAVGTLSATKYHDRCTHHIRARQGSPHRGSGTTGQLVQKPAVSR